MCRWESTTVSQQSEAHHSELRNCGRGRKRILTIKPLIDSGAGPGPAAAAVVFHYSEIA